MSVCDAHFTIAKSNKRSYTLYVYTVNYGGLGIHKTLMNLSAYTHTHTNAHTYVCTYTHTHTHTHRKHLYTLCQCVSNIYPHTL